MRVRNGDGKLTRLGQVLALLASLVAFLPAAGWATIKLFDLDTVKARRADVNDVREDVRNLDGKINCILLEVSYADCPAVQADAARRTPRIP